MKTVKHTVASIYLSAIVNNDYSGLEKCDIPNLNTWLAMNDLSFSDPINWVEAGFCFDAVSGLKADCHTITWKV